MIASTASRPEVLRERSHAITPPPFVNRHVPKAPRAIREAAASALAAIRARQGPTFIEAKVYRWLQHVGPHQGYRPLSEAEPWMADDADDQVARLGGMLDAAQAGGSTPASKPKSPPPSVSPRKARFPTHRS